MKPRFRTVFWIGAALVVVVLLVLAFRPQPVPVDVAEAERGSLVVTVRDEGRTRVRDEYVVSAPVAGRLLRVDYKAGAYVHAGERVATMRPSEPSFLDPRARAEARAAVDSAEAALDAARAELERARAQAQFARTELERVQRLRERDLASPGALDRARLDLNVAEAALAGARQSVRIREAELQAARDRLIEPGGGADSDASVELRSPVAGRVLTVARESEAVVAAGAEIMTVGDADELEIVVEMLSSEAVQVQPGAEVIIDNFGRSEAPLRGRVRLVEPYGFTKVSALGVEEQRVNVIVDFLGSPDEWSMLGHGYRVEAAVVTWSADDVLQAPVAALFRSGGEWAVFRVEDGRARLTPVEVGRDNGERAVILSGLSAGDTLVMYPGERVSDGVAVERR